MSALTQEALLVRNALLLKGLENPIIELNLDSCTRMHQIAKHMVSIIKLLKLNLNNDSLSNTPQRIAKMYVEEIFLGLDYLNFPKIAIIKNTMQISDVITIQDINVTSICEHHFIVFNGKATVSYIPNKCIIGLSKINKIVQFFSKRPQLQERLTQQILLALQTLLYTNNVAVFINAVHYCVKAREVHDTTSTVNTTALGGVFKSNVNFREEFLYNAFNKS